MPESTESDDTEWMPPDMFNLYFDPKALSLDW
jgi:hypothetical protein